MAIAYSQAERSKAGRTLVLVLAIGEFLKYFVVPHIPGDTLPFLTIYLTFLCIGTVLFRTMRIRGWSYKWVLTAHIVWIALAFGNAAVRLLPILMVHKAPLAKAYAKNSNLSPELVNDPVALNRYVNKVKTAWIVKGLLFNATVALAGFSYIVWSCISAGRSRHDYGMPQPTDESDSAQSSSYELHET